MITKQVQRYGDTNIIRVTKEFKPGENVILLSESEYKKLLIGEN